MVKANWGAQAPLGEPEATEEIDPFASASSMSPMPTGMHLEIDSPVPSDASLDDLERRCRTLLKLESRYDASGITCGLKDSPDMTCVACPVSKAKDPDHPMSGLCMIGRDQDIVHSMLVARHAAKSDA